MGEFAVLVAKATWGSYTDALKMECNAFQHHPQKQYLLELCSNSSTKLVIM